MPALLRMFQISGFLEATSYLVLLFIAMPLKYIWEMPMFVRWTGSFHGLFFCIFCLMVVLVAQRQKWSLKVTALAFLSAFFPFGPFIFERRYMPELKASR